MTRPMTANTSCCARMTRSARSILGLRRGSLLALGLLGWGLMAQAHVRAQSGHAPATPNLSRTSDSDPCAEDAALDLPQQLALGRPTRPITLELVQEPANSPTPAATTTAAAPGPTVSLVARGLGAPVRLELSGTPTHARVATLALADGTNVALLRLELRAQVIEAVVGARGGRAELLWHGRTSLGGDPGERHAEALRSLVNDAGEAQGLVVGRVHERIRVCGRPPALLAAEQLTGRGRAPRAVSLSRLAPGVQPVELTAEAIDADAPTAPRLRPLLFDVSSGASMAGEAGLVSVDALTAPAPTSLTDGDESTGWRPQARAGAGEFVSARTLDATLPIERLEFSLGLPDAAGSLAQIRALWIIPETGTPLLVQIPAGARRVRVVPPTPLMGRCLSVVLARVEGRPGDAPPALTEVRAFTNIDRPGGGAEWMGALAEGGAGRGHAIRVLAALGLPALRALHQAWPEMPSDERRAALRVAEARMRDLPEAGVVLELGARDANAEVSEAALTALNHGLPETGPILAALTRGGGDLGERTGRLLARRAPALALPALLEALATSGGSDLPGLRRALARAAADAGPEAGASLREWADGNPPAPALVAAALALSGQGSDVAVDLTGRARALAQDFPERYRATLALGKLPAEDAGDGWLEAELLHAEEWMLRAAALEALSSRHSPRLVALTRGALTDEYPRVRATAAGLLRGDASSLVPLATVARRDAWPAVRAAALQALVPDPRGRRILHAALGDPSPRVRTVAARALGELHDQAAVPLLIARLRAEGEWPAVLEASAGALSALCARAAVPALLDLVERSRRPDAWEPDRDVAVAAIAALGQLGGDQAQSALQSLVTSQDAGLADSSRRALAQTARCHVGQ